MSSRLFILDLAEGRVFSVQPDGTDKKIIAIGGRRPDGVAVDAEAGHIYWTNMGDPSRNDGSIERCGLDGSNRTTIIPEGATFTPKQLQIDRRGGKLYWCDREGMRVMRANLDGSDIETLVQTGATDADRRDATNWCVGIALDPGRGQIYWTQKGPDNAGKGRIFRAGIELPKGETAAKRSDIEVLHDGLPEPIDLEIDHAKRILYWTDRGDPPLGNTVARAYLDAGRDGGTAPQIVFRNLMEGIGIALDGAGDRMFMTDLAGSVYVASLDGSHPSVLLMTQGNLSGIAYANLS
ncbi:MAG: 3-hydroxyacyl-CoA dehydrogenase [Ramlibacter sp.]|nr:3-hydroxyacyl-CoA dehydrogenase [Ramlibacter sp.]